MTNIINQIKVCRPKLLINILLEPKVISLYQQYTEPGQPAHPYSLTRLYNVGWPTLSSYLDIPKNDNGQFQNWKADYSV